MNPRLNRVAKPSRPVRRADSGAQAFSFSTYAACPIPRLAVEGNPRRDSPLGFKHNNSFAPRFNAHRYGLFTPSPCHSCYEQDEGFSVRSRHAIAMPFHAKFHVAFALPTPVWWMGKHRSVSESEPGKVLSRLRPPVTWSIAVVSWARYLNLLIVSCAPRSEDRRELDGEEYQWGSETSMCSQQR